MQHQITHGPSFSMLRVDLNPGETLVAEAGSMVARSESLQMAVKLNAGGSGGFLDWSVWRQGHLGSGRTKLRSNFCVGLRVT